VSLVRGQNLLDNGPHLGIICLAEFAKPQREARLKLSGCWGGGDSLMKTQAVVQEIRAGATQAGQAGQT